VIGTMNIYTRGPREVSVEELGGYSDEAERCSGMSPNGIPG
jgi:hypothetical protein